MDKFFGDDPAREFWDILNGIGFSKIDATKHGLDVDLTSLELSRAYMLVSAVELLIRNGEGVIRKPTTDNYPDEERERFLRSSTGMFHQALFELADRFDNVWVEGKQNYGIRVAHEGPSSGVSLVTSKDTETINIHHAH